MKNTARLVCALTLATVPFTPHLDAASALGDFTGHGDVGKVLKPGSAKFDSAAGSYEIAGGGDNMWATNDAYHFVWKQVSGDVTLAADITWIGTSAQAHRKACLLIRQSLDSTSAYADAAVHGDGLTSLQYRETPGAATHEIQSNVSKPARVRIEKRGDYVSMSIAAASEALRPAGGSFRIQFKEPFYIGLGICAHDNNAIESATFSKVEITALPPVATNARPTIASTLETINVTSTDRRVVYYTTDRIEAPNWSRDGQLYFNRSGLIYRIPTNSSTAPQLVDTGTARRVNNDHGISPDGTQLAISDQSEAGGSRVYIVPIGGGAARKITPLAPSYWHGWSPDGKTIAFCGQRNNEFDVYTIPAEGGEEKRLTTAPGLDDGPEYSPDGQFIYFNSERSGSMQIWRMKSDGSEQTQLTSHEYHNWFAHPSPDGRWLVFLSFNNDVRSNDHPANKNVVLRLMPVRGGEIRALAKLFGGQGTINVPSWSPDSRQVAFVSYQPVSP